jgi:hypothetical protein
LGRLWVKNGGVSLSFSLVLDWFFFII